MCCLGLRRFLAFGVIIRVICVICGLFLICSVFHFVCCLGYGVYWLLGVIGLRRFGGFAVDICAI